MLRWIELVDGVRESLTPEGVSYRAGWRGDCGYKMSARRHFAKGLQLAADAENSFDC